MQINSSRFITAVLCLTAGLLTASAQPRASVQRQALTTSSAGPPMQAPIIGFAWTQDPALRESAGRVALGIHGDLRAILGVPGASTLSDPIALPRGITNLYFAPGQGFAIVERSGATLGVIAMTGAGAGSPRALTSEISRPDVVAFSPGGTSAVVFSASQRRAELFTGLPDAPQLAMQSSASDLPDGVRMLALADDGKTVLAGAGDGRVFLLAAGRAPQAVFAAGDLAAISFAPGSSSAVVFDRSGGKLSLIADVTGTPAARVLVDGLTMTGEALMQVDASAVSIAGAQSNHVWRINLATSAVQSVQTSASVTMLQPLRSAGRFLLSAEASQPAWMLDTSGTRSAVYFVPGGKR